MKMIYQIPGQNVEVLVLLKTNSQQMLVALKAKVLFIYLAMMQYTERKLLIAIF